MTFINANQIIQNGRSPEIKKLRADCLSILDSALQSVNPYKVVKKHINEHPFEYSKHGEIYLLAFGKASVPMAQAVCDTLEIKKGLAITNDTKNKVKNREVKTFTVDHPIPTNRNIEATNQALSMIKKLEKNDTLVTLISGGGSALFCKPRVPIEDIQRITTILLKSGADIKEINTIRKHLSYIKGGQLARLANCRIFSYIVSDVVGDSIEFIASGPTAPDTTTFEDARETLFKYNLWNKIPESVRKVIERGLRGNIPETPKPGDKVFGKVKNVVVANNSLACETAKKRAEELGYKAKIFSTNLTGEARKVGAFLVKKALDELSEKEVMISGGETTVEIKGKGKGGRNQEMVLSAVEMLKDLSLVFVSFATDGIDGNSDAAGAISDCYTLERALDRGLNLREYLRNNDSYHFFKNLGDLLITGSTGTNVMDIQILLNY